MLDEALIYLDMGWCVYPAHSVDLSNGLCSCGRKDCPCPGKHPIGRWTEFQGRLPTKREVQVWFSNLDCNIGIVTGRISGVVVVDADGEEGLESIRRLKLSPTLTARTGGGGYHLFYSITHPVSSRVRVTAGVDIRGDGGYVVLPPSTHRSGRTYEWLEPIPLAPFDNDLFPRIVENHQSNGWTDELWEGVPEGSRSLSAARLAGRYFGLGLNLKEVWILMTSWNKHNIPPLEASDLRRTVEAIHRKHEETVVSVQIRTLNQIRDLLPKGEEPNARKE